VIETPACATVSSFSQRLNASHYDGKVRDEQSVHHSSTSGSSSIDHMTPKMISVPVLLTRNGR
jgi:hypothetical protein